ncbi:MAG: hypothetical protein JOY62_03200 [Acidobacteriaceae bacterium]|nr:hypothetical protein [Acidobacteriaceae bacterium]MBV9778957.1 hypothetical protein [Acidobacteriaceae bacterium]
MRPKLLRLVYAFEFLIALVAIFTAWSEIGGQAALDLMHWGWKFGLSLALAGAIVAYTAAVVSEESIWSLRSARWLTAIIIVTVVMGGVTYYYVLQEEASEFDDSGTISAYRSAAILPLDS